MGTVLIVEDDPVLRRGLEDNFRVKGYDTLTACDGNEGLANALKERPDLIILDIMLPGIDGYEVCSHIRAKNLDMPIIMLTARHEESDVVLGLNTGADDYVSKPFSIKELLARANAFMRRRGACEPLVYEFGGCRLDLRNGTLLRQGEDVALTPGELKMLHLFLKRPGCPLTREEIRAAVWGHARFVTVRDVDQTIARLQRKIEPDPSRPPYIRMMGNEDYQFEVPQAHGNRTDR
ncbi:MAG: response regulator transcription factor [Phycisphaerales bacterium]|nr:MAG: response regulator transcription factor [Phycisphaerales bacterium]